MAYASSVKLAAEFNSNGKLVDATGTADLTAYGNGGSLISDPVKYGDNAFRTDKGNNDVLVANTTQNTIGDSSTFTIQYWYYEPESGRYDYRITRGPYNPLMLLLGSSGFNGMVFWYNNVNLGSYNLTGVSVLGWNRVNVVFNSAGSGYCKIYVNNSLVATRVTTVNCFDGDDRDMHLGTETGSGYGVYGFYALDRFILSTVESTDEIVPLPDGKAGIKIGFNCGGNNRIKIGGRI